MPRTQHPVLNEYDRKNVLFHDFKNAAEGLVRDLLLAESIRVHTVTSRVKERSSLSAKISRIGKEYGSLSQVTDIIGIRVITHLEDQVDVVGRLLEKEFAIDRQNSVDKRKAMDPDRFGYLSLHYVCCLSPERLKLPEYRRFEGLCLEFQVRSILQHAWAEIEHDLGYKTGATIPAPMRRRFSRLAGLLEIADSEFSSLSRELNDYSKRIKEAIVSSPKEVGLDDVSLAEFIETDPTSITLDNEMARYVGASLEPSTDIAHLVQVLRYAGIETIDDLRNAMFMHRDLVRLQWEERVRGEGKETLIRGIGLFHLFQVLAVLQGGLKKLTEAFVKYRIGTPMGDREDTSRRIADTILRVHQRLTTDKK